VGEFMLRLLEATPGAMGIGIDLNDEDLARGRANAEARNLSDRLPCGAHDDHPPSTVVGGRARFIAVCESAILPSRITERR
jgi:hypothetical protein